MSSASSSMPPPSFRAAAASTRKKPSQGDDGGCGAPPLSLCHPYAKPTAVPSQESTVSAASTEASSFALASESSDFMSSLSAVKSVIQNAMLPQDVTLGERELCDLEMLLSGAFAPLKGYLASQDFDGVVRNCRLPSANNVIWPMPIVLPVPATLIRVNAGGSPVKGQRIKLRNPQNSILAELVVEDCYVPDLELYMLGVLGTKDLNHPYAKHLAENHANCVYIGGTVQPGAHPLLHFDFRELRETPAQVRQRVQSCDAVVGFQTRNPMHRSHFELTMQAMRQLPRGTKQAHLLVTPACGPTQPGDIRYQVRVRCYKKILPEYEAIGQSASLVLLPLAMRMAGPREAVWHALIRKNYGCTHFIVGRDHAGPSTRRSIDGQPFYRPYEAHELLLSLEAELNITPIFGRNMVFDGSHYMPEDQMADTAGALQISGSKLRQLLVDCQPIPSWYSFESVVEELRRFYRKRSQQGFCVYFTGLPCSGKSTLAVAVEAALQEREQEVRNVTVLDADIIRTHLSKGLGFSRGDRQCNVRRIGYVASVVVRHRGICLVANIAPYEEDRLFNRKLVEEGGSPGSYIEVHVSTPLRICEQRDVKELYKKARAGEIQHFTGVSDPYEVPRAPELVIDSSDDLAGKVEQIMEYLTSNQWIQ